MRVAVITANLGNFDQLGENVPQSVEYDFHRFTDDNFPPRFCSMTPRLQARIPKCFAWQIVPDYEYYIWLDGSVILSNRDSVKWFLEQCDGVDIALFKHPERTTVQEEADYLKKRIEKGCKYITPRYKNELIDEQLSEIQSDGFKDMFLFESRAFIYRNCLEMQRVLKEWWYHISRYHQVDQLSLPYVLWKSEIIFKCIPLNTKRNPYISYVRTATADANWK